ncbi:ubiquinol oxidase subunit II [Ancylobacter polymorphus]|uniref:Cytochrome o ubiquinol oxidase subunit 2 n=1 Tax=Ancylobacter polymorphus TaxID=223390 RepID=A0ABU0B9D8_9HYPH|nr:COX aromatic rich motif-containing protein [Ancylobacter polymorphus]MDQ0302444.1 cytochrome o ubiquinol oxidase subunit 2 [Ancylobacter polymorphus]
MAGVTALAMPCAASAAGFLEPAGPVAAAQLSHFGTISALMLIVIVPMFVALPLVLLRYRRGGKGTYRPDWEFNWGLELLIWGIPVALVAALGTALWNHTLKNDPYRPLGPAPLVVEVIALDWKFLFLYPEQGVATLDLLVLPKDRPVTLKLTSGTVMQSFIVPRLAGQIYAMAGMQTQLNLIADATGDFTGRNTQYNGLGFATQSFTTRVVSAEDFASWVTGAKAQPAGLDAAGYKALLPPSVVNEPVIYGRFTPGLFDQIIASFAPGMAGGHQGHEAPAGTGTPAAAAPAAAHQHDAHTPEAAQ